MDFESLSNKLKSLGVQVGAKSNLQPAKKAKPLQQVIRGREIETIFGPVFSVRSVYHADHMQGDMGIRPSGSYDRISALVSGQVELPFQLSDLIFLDTETTGLSGGTGTMAFMVGVARFIGTDLVLEQFFLRHPAEEPALLAAFEEFIDGGKVIVSYNGKSFDVPILNTRFILQRLNNSLTKMGHLDLLTLTRRTWKKRLGACNLGNIEKEILGLRRTKEEVPGYLVPELYADYLRNGDPTPLIGVFYHNEQDVVSLAALFAYLADILEDPESWLSVHAEDLGSIGRMMEAMGDADLASKMYDRGLSQEASRSRQEILERKAALLKRQKRHAEAASCWVEAADLGSLQALIELAMYHEHRLNDPSQALVYTERAIEVSESATGRTVRMIEHRRTRLTRKLTPKSDPGDSSQSE